VTNFDRSFSNRNSKLPQFSQKTFENEETRGTSEQTVQRSTAGKLSRQTQGADESRAESTVLRVLGHRPDLIESYLKFHYPLHNGGVVDPALKEMVPLRIASLNQCLT
jgi:hypothetical protein